MSFAVISQINGGRMIAARRLPVAALTVLVILMQLGCGSSQGAFDFSMGHKGLHDGEFLRPRAVACDIASGREKLYVVDFAGRVQAFTQDGRFLLGWRTPAIANGRPAGMGVGIDGCLWIADSHYHRILKYSPQGELLWQLQEESKSAGMLSYLADVEQDASGCLFVTAFNDDGDVIRKYDASGKLLKEWGGRGSEPGQFSRPRGMAISSGGELFVADSCNHRIQVFDLEGNFRRSWGTHGNGPGQLNYPYDVALNGRGDLFVVEYGSHRVQRFSTAGEPVGAWGGPGRSELGKLHSPWGLAVDAMGRVLVADTENHRLQRISF